MCFYHDNELRMGTGTLFFVKEGETMEKPYHLLVVIPYEEMRYVVEQATLDYEDLTVTITVAERSDASDVLRAALRKGRFDAILAHTHVAAELSATLPLPVMALDVSVYDLLATLQIADVGSVPYCVAASSEIIGKLQSILKFLHRDIALYAMDTADQANIELQHIVESKIQLVVTDSFLTSRVSALGIRTLPFSYTRETIAEALDACLKQLENISLTLKRDLPYTETVEHTEIGVAIMNTQGQYRYRNVAFRELQYDALKNLLYQRVGEAEKEREIRFSLRHENRLLRVTARHATQESADERLTIFYVRPSIVWSAPSPFMDIKLDKHAKTDYSMRFIADDHTRELIRQVSTNNAAAFPVFVYGETGTGTEHCVRFIHAVSNYKNAPFLRINCQLLTEKTWNALLNNTHSLLNDTGCTIHFKKLQMLSLPMQTQLNAYIEDTRLLRRNHIISSALVDIQDKVREGAFLHSLYCKLCGTVIRLPSLNERPEQIAVFAGMYLSQYNDMFSKQIIGYEPEALELLQKHDWKINLDQLERTIRTLVAASTSEYITADEVRGQLARYDSQATLPDWLDLHQPLDKIREKIIEQVYLEENMDTQRTAARLGINRSTLWRIRKNMGS